MSILSDSRVQIILADYVSTDPLGKLNVLGGNVTIVGAQEGQTATLGLAVIVSVPEKYVGQTFALSAELFDVTDGLIVQVPAPDGTLQALRAQQAVTVPQIQLPPGLAKPEGVFQTHILSMNFLNGLPVTSGHTYEWRAQIDGQSHDWFHRFHVLAPPPGVILGGPANPPVIPGVGSYVVPQPTPPDDSSDESSTDDD